MPIGGTLDLTIKIRRKGWILWKLTTLDSSPVYSLYWFPLFSWLCCTSKPASEKPKRGFSGLLNRFLTTD